MMQPCFQVCRSRNGEIPISEDFFRLLAGNREPHFVDFNFVPHTSPSVACAVPTPKRLEIRRRLSHTKNRAEWPRAYGQSMVGASIMMAKRGLFAWQACDKMDELILIKS